MGEFTVTDKGICPVCGYNGGDRIPVAWNFYDLLYGAPKNWQYTVCHVCRCAFIEEMKDWQPRDFADKIYNGDYNKIDTGYDGSRVRKHLPFIVNAMNSLHCRKTVDFGGGNGLLADLLTEAGFEAYSFDFFARRDEPAIPDGSFDALTAIEVLEHEIEPHKLWSAIRDFLKPGGFFLCTTEFCDNKDISNWFYANPRAGHDLIYSISAIRYCAVRFGFEYCGDINEWHLLRKH